VRIAGVEKEGHAQSAGREGELPELVEKGPRFPKVHLKIK
jgi:hypothetical protein